MKEVVIVIEGIEKVYEEIANSMVERLPERWFTAWFDAVFFPDHEFYSGEYISSEGDRASSFPTNRRGQLALRQLRDMFERANRPLWCRVRFELHSTGKFNMNWGYDDCDENGFAKFNADAEIE